MSASYDASRTWWMCDWCVVDGVPSPVSMYFEFLNVQRGLDLLNKVIPVMHLFVCLDLVDEKVPILDIVVPKITLNRLYY